MAAYKALSKGAEELKKPSRTKTNRERLIETFARHLKLPQEEAARELEQSLGEVFPKLKPHFGKITGAAKFLDWAKEHYPIILATNPVWPVELVHLRMNWGGITPGIFRSITTADRMHACKPSQEYYLEILKQESFEASECLMIGNERKMDLPATRVGVAVFLIRPEASALTCIEAPNGNHPGAWRGNYQHLKSLLLTNQEA
jgi:FMN phosphatase YigB (HAD superfamily)